MTLLVDEPPCVCSVEAANPHRGGEFGVEVPKVYPMLGDGSWRQRLPVSNAATGSTVNCPQSLVAPDVLGSGLRVNPPNLTVTPCRHTKDEA